MKPFFIPIAALCLAFTFQAQTSSDLEAPFKVKAGDEPIDVDVGHAAPCFTDWDGDGLNDLLIGQFGGGKLRIYRNVGTGTDPRFSDFFYFKAAGVEGTVPAS